MDGGGEEGEKGVQEGGRHGHALRLPAPTQQALYSIFVFSFRCEFVFFLFDIKGYLARFLTSGFFIKYLSVGHCFTFKSVF